MSKFKLYLLLGLALSVSVLHAAERRTVKIETKNISMVFSVKPDSVAVWQYYGQRLSEGAYAGFAKRGQYEDAMYPSYSGFFYLKPAVRLTQPDGVMTTDFVFSGSSSRVIDANRTETVISLKDRIYPVFADVVFTAYRDEDIITQKVILHHIGKKKMTVEQLASTYVPIESGDYYLTSFYGTWGQEARMQEEHLVRGVKSIECTKGMRSTRITHPSYLVSTGRPAEENDGEVYAGSLAWSGNYAISFEVDPAGKLHIVGGLNQFAAEYHLAPNRKFETPEMIHSYSSQGKGQISRNFHDWARRYNLNGGEKENPVLLNSWEGVYFKFDEPTLCKMIDDAADMGIEMFVLDDGWFGNKFPRNGDKAGLGDWQVNEKKLPGGLASIADYAAGKGLRFGIWVELEMVNPDSELFQKHPDWIVKSGQREIPLKRTQYVLDLTNPKVQDFVFKSFDDVLSMSSNITYVKWDANRSIANPGSEYLPGDEQTHFWYDYVRGLYSVLDRIRAKYPDVMIQSCAAGGGRMDYGLMKYYDETWTSDNTYAPDRIFIQYGTSTFMPAKVMGAHVSANPNHQTNMPTPLKFRFDVAMSGRLGFELQPKDLSDSEKEFSRRAVETYKRIRPVIQQGDLYRLCSPYEGNGWASLMYVSKDRTKAVFFCYNTEFRVAERFASKLYGLDPDRNYKVTEINKADSSSAFSGEGKSFTGDFLQKTGINLSIKKPFTSTVLLLEAE